MSQLNEMFNQRNLMAEVNNAMNTDRQFVQFITEGFVVLAAMKVCNIATKDDTPEGAAPSMDFLDQVAEKNYNMMSFNSKSPEEMLSSQIISIHHTRAREQHDYTMKV